MSPQYRDAGECALVVEFGDRIDDLLADQVLALDAVLPPVPGLLETVPTYRSLMVHYDPLVLPRAALIAHVEAALAVAALRKNKGQLWLLPACYDPALAIDLPHVAAITGLEPDKVAMTHAAATYRVVMYGFAPGWAYLTGLPPVLNLPRRPTPRDIIPAGSLIIAGGLAIVAAKAMPSGWHIIGQTAEQLFAPERGASFLVAPGDRLRFDPVDIATHQELAAKAAGGQQLARKIAG